MAFIAQLGVKGMALLGVTPNMKQSERHSWENIITSNTIESGSEIHDHMVRAPLRISETFVVSFLGRFGIENVIKTTPVIYLLMELRKTKQIIDVVTNGGIYKNMAIVGVDGEMIEGSVNSVRCTISFQEILEASVEESVVSSSTTLQKTENLSDPIKGMARRIPTRCAASCTPAAVSSKTKVAAASAPSFW
jgi:hypothetical protein